MWKNFYGFAVFGFIAVWALPTSYFKALMLHANDLRSSE